MEADEGGDVLALVDLGLVGGGDGDWRGVLLALGVEDDDLGRAPARVLQGRNSTDSLACDLV